MPYTPPSHRSPASSASASPNVSRRSSLQSGSRPQSLPRSASYLNKHRRTPSVSAVSDGSSTPLTPQATSEDLPGMAAAIAAFSDAVRQSPPPINGESGMPRGAIISPPESASSGSDDEAAGPEMRMRGRKVDRLKDLRDAVSQIPMARTPSPTRQADEESHRLAVSPAGLTLSFSTSALDGLPKSGRRISHVRSATEPNAGILKSASSSVSVSEEDTDEDVRKKPQMVRKKSGELVRPALRPSSRRRPSSMPGTPVFSKAVHFDSHLEHVRHFLQVDRPLAVSAGSSPVESYDSETEYPFSSGEKRTGARSPPYEWEILTSNFPQDSKSRQSQPVKLEKVWLSQDQKSMMGSVAVANLAFQKHVTCRFTLDYWKTTSEVVAEYSHEIRPHTSPVGNDRFNFSIKLSDTANLESKTLFFCIRYVVNGVEYWDNNNSANFQVDFRKKHLPQKGKNNFQGASSRPLNGLPRSSRRQNPSTSPRPKSMSSVNFDDFGSAESSKLNFGQSIHDYLGESDSGTSGLRLKSRSSSNLASDNITSSLASPSGAAFANRYDFGASLSAAVQAAKDSMSKEKDKDGLYMKSHIRGPQSQTIPTATAPVTTAIVLNTVPVSGSPTVGGSPSGPGTHSPNSGLASSSYEELVKKYCFFGSKQSSPNLEDGTLKNGLFDGSAGAVDGASSTPKAAHPGSSTAVVRHAGHAMGHSVGVPHYVLDHGHGLLQGHSLMSSTAFAGPIPYYSAHATPMRSGEAPPSPPMGLPSPLSSGVPSNQASQATSPLATPPANRTTTASPSYMSLTSTPNELTFHPHQQAVIGERFPWGTETQAATAIRG